MTNMDEVVEPVEHETSLLGDDNPDIKVELCSSDERALSVPLDINTDIEVKSERICGTAESDSTAAPFVNSGSFETEFLAEPVKMILCPSVKSEIQYIVKEENVSASNKSFVGYSMAENDFYPAECHMETDRLNNLRCADERPVEERKTTKVLSENITCKHPWYDRSETVSMVCNADETYIPIPDGHYDGSCEETSGDCCEDPPQECSGAKEAAIVESISSSKDTANLTEDKPNLLHITAVAEKTPFLCTLCSKRFRHKSDFTRHVRVHTGEKPFACPYCNKRFSQNCTLTNHIRIHTGERPYTCPHCNKKFSDKNSITRHIRTHTGDKPYPCSYCDKKFNNKSDLTRHTRKHTGEKPFSCSQCSKKCITKSDLTMHMRIHTGVKPYSCPHCKKEFTQKCHLARHMRLHTTD